MQEYLIGAGGWAYFWVPGINPLIAYSRTFDFVEVNSTFYKIPELKEVERWRKLVPSKFQFSIRANHVITHRNKFETTEETIEAFEKMCRICRVLKADTLHLLKPAAVKLKSETLSKLIQSVDLRNIHIALELRGMSASALPRDLMKTMQENNIIHCIDLSKGETPAYDSDTLYTRLFGRGERNIYQPLDKELAKIDEAALQTNSLKIKMSFHFVKMYKDASRLKIYKRTGKFPSVTRTKGLSSLEQVLREDAVFPTTRPQLIQKQGWKLFDTNENTRTRAKEILEKLPDSTYNDVNAVIETLRA